MQETQLQGLISKRKDRYIISPKDKAAQKKAYMKEYMSLYKRKRNPQSSDLTGYIFTSEDYKKIIDEKIEFYEG